MDKLSLDLSSVTTVAVDLAKHVFQIHGCDASGKTIIANAQELRYRCAKLLTPAP